MRFIEKNFAKIIFVRNLGFSWKLRIFVFREKIFVKKIKLVFREKFFDKFFSKKISRKIFSPNNIENFSLKNFRKFVETLFSRKIFSPCCPEIFSRKKFFVRNTRKIIRKKFSEKFFVVLDEKIFRENVFEKFTRKFSLVVSLIFSEIFFSPTRFETFFDPN